MIPYKSIIKINKQSEQPIYLQIANCFIHCITTGIIQPGTKLAGSRKLSELLVVNRRTVVAALDELTAQGWVRSEPSRGSFVNEDLPEIKAQTINEDLQVENEGTLNFTFKQSPEIPTIRSTGFLKIDDGYPDVRIAPLKELARNYSHILNSSMATSLMSYRQFFWGDEMLRDQLVKYLGQTRGINVSVENVMITRGSQMAFYLLFQTLLNNNDKVIVGNPGFNEGYETIKMAGGQLITVPVDHHGIDIENVEEVCKKHKIKALFIISHHHYPTTVSLSAERRMRLLQLAEKFGFAIVEDDYDYDFHYSSSPILPLASVDGQKSVAYVGSFSKTLAPSLRMGFIVAHKDLIASLVALSKHIDGFGNTALERALAMMFEDGTMRRHLKKALKTYHDRRDVFAEKLKGLEKYFVFNKPEGGLAFWLALNKETKLKSLIEQGKKNQLHIPNTESWALNKDSVKAIRIGFASMNESEMNFLFEKLEATFKAVRI